MRDYSAEQFCISARLLSHSGYKQVRNLVAELFQNPIKDPLQFR